MRMSSLLYTLLLLYMSLPVSLCDRLLHFGMFGDMATVDPCVEECKCYDWESSSTNAVGDRQKRFTVNCTEMKFGLFQGFNVPKNLPFNTTDLIVSEYHLGSLNMASFPNQGFPLNPMFLSVSLEECYINYLSSDTFQGNSFVSIRNISLSRNLIELLTEGTFLHLPYLENISVDGNFLRKVETAAFRNLPQVHAINLSHNAISEIQPGAFDNLPHLECLDLSYNWLTTIPGEDISSQLPSLRLLGLEGNFWNCSCEMSWILTLNHSVLAQTQGVCLHPSNLNGTALQQLTTRDFQHCLAAGTVIHSYASTIAGVCISLIVLCTTFVVFFYKRHSSRHPSLRVIGHIEFDSRNPLGQNVFRGRLRDGRLAAIKRLPRLSRQSSKELDILLHISEKGPPHPNIIQYLWVEKDLISTYIALELCVGDVKSAVSHSEVHPYLKPECCLLQITQGMEYIHSLKVQHRDIKPQNILWKYSGIKSDEIRFIISDFDLGHFSDEESAHKSNGTLGWTAPELWSRDKDEQRSTAVDIFSLGCVFFYVLTTGGHPFGPVSEMETCQHNISKGNSSLSGLKDHCTNFVAALAEDLIREMTKLDASRRPGAGTILKHPLLWDTTKILQFFHRIGNYMEDRKSEDASRLRDMLECNVAVVFEGSWMERLDKAAQKDVQGFKKECTKLCSLLRVVRNKIEHFWHLRQELREIYLGSPEGVAHYYNQRFPKLLAYTYWTEQEWTRGH